MTRPTGAEPNADPLRQILAEQAIQRVIQDYGRGVDEHDSERIRACFFEDATITYGDGPTRSRDDAIDWLAQVTPGLHALSHYFGPPIVDLSSDDSTATCQTWCINVLQYRRDGQGRARQEATGLLYDDIFECREGLWRILERRNRGEWALDVDGNSRLPGVGSDGG